MNIRTLKLTVAMAACCAGLGACGHHSDSPPPVVEPPPPPPPVVFSDFVKQQFADTADDTDPVPVDDTDFAFSDQDDPNAFDDLLSTTP